MNLIDIPTVLKLTTIFENNRWNTHAGHDVVFEKFCYLLTNLTENQRDLILELCERYLWINNQEYDKRLFDVFKKIKAADINGVNKIYLFPVINPDDEDETKSGHAFLYLIYGYRTLLPPPFNKIKFEKLEQFEKIHRDVFKLKEDELLLLVDDFLGSGKTITSTLNELAKNEFIKSEQVKVISLVSQKDAINVLDSRGINYYISEICSKGITDFYPEPDRTENVGTMRKIEKMIPFSRKYKFGFKKSEALITMIRTPNNTFPIFWMPYTKNEETFDAPFSRF